MGRGLSPGGSQKYAINGYLLHGADGRAVNFLQLKCRADETSGALEADHAGVLANPPLPRALASVPFVWGSSLEAAKFLTEALVVAASQQLNGPAS